MSADPDAPSAPSAPRPVTPMGILVGKLADLVDLLDGPDRDDAAVRRGIRDAYDLAAGLDPYLGRCTTPESSALRSRAAATAAHDWSRHAGSGGAAPLEQEMLSGHVEGQLLKMLVHATRARRVLEVGMFTGYSALAMAEALPEDGRVVACEVDAHAAEFAERCFRATDRGHRIDIHVGPAAATLAELATVGEVFDLVFIDADKGGYLGYVTAVLDDGLLAPHGLICVDNTLMQGQPWTCDEPAANGVAIAAFNEAVATDPRVEQVVIPLRDGLTLIRRVDRP
ncbi:MAG: class I SAM-dependent methyltransferase [Pseudonocardia sp.]|nr:class I SAM-dependent methyltransferase [Pseudonocardia sp.]